MVEKRPENLEILDEENLLKVLQSLENEIRKFNAEVEKRRLETGKNPEKVKEGRVLPPLLRSLQLLLQRPEAKIVVRPKSPGIFLQSQKDPEGRKRLKFGLRNPVERKKAGKLPEDSQMRCDILRQFGIMWLAPFCHLSLS